jgi:hypothetical protein
MSLMEFVAFPPGCGQSVTDFWVWGAYRAQLRCPDDVSDDICECGVPGGALKLSSTGYPDHGHYGDLPLLGKIPTAERGIKPRTSCLVVRSSDYQATRLALFQMLYWNSCMGLVTDDVLWGDGRIDNAVLLECLFYCPKSTNLSVKPMDVVTHTQLYRSHNFPWNTIFSCR